MTTDLATLDVLKDLDGTLEEVQGRAGQIDQRGTARTVLALTEDLPQVMEGIGGLRETGADLGALRVLAHARALAAKTAGDHDDQFTAAHLAATLALATGDPQNLASARVLMEDAADSADSAAQATEPELVDAEVEDAPAQPGQDPAAALGALLRTAREKFTDAVSATRVDASTGEVTGGAASDVAGAKAGSEASDPLREHPVDPAGDADWAGELAGLAVQAEQDPRSVRARVSELEDLILLAPGIGTGIVRPQVLQRLFTLHRLHQSALSPDTSAAQTDRDNFLSAMNSLVPGELSATAPVQDRILLNRYRSTAQDATPQQRLAAAQQLAHLHGGQGDKRAMAEALLRAGEELEKLKRMAEMYDTYQRSLNLAQDVGATDIRIWATIRLAFAQYIAGDKMTATQMLLDQDAELPVEKLDGEKEKAAMAEAKVALANLFSEAGDRDGKSFFLTQAVDLFEEIGRTDSAAQYRAQL